MLIATESQIASARFAEYVDELRHFSRSHQLSFGAPAHLPQLLDRLEHSPIFRAECTSMLRAVFYREHGEAPPEELLMLLIVAWGGDPTGPPSPAIQATITGLLRFTVGLMRTPVVPVEFLEHVREAAGEAAPAPMPEELPGAGVDEPSTPMELPEPAERTEPPAPTSRPAPDRKTLPYTPGQTTLDDIESAIQLLSIRSPDVKRYLQLLKYREVQLAGDQRRIAERAAQSQPGRVLPLDDAALSSPAAGVPSTLAPARSNPWDPNSEFQAELRRFAAAREAKLAALEARQRPASGKISDAAHSAWQRLTEWRRHT